MTEKPLPTTGRKLPTLCRKSGGLLRTPKPDNGILKQKVNQPTEIKLLNRFSILSDLSSDCENDETIPNIESNVEPNDSSPNDKLVVNLSDKVLSNDELSILKRGLKFCPTQKKVNAGDTRRELDNFHNKLRPIQFFDKENSKRNTDPQNPQVRPFADTNSLRKIKEKSNWRAPLGSAALETFINMNEIVSSKMSNQKIAKQNIDENERKALKNLSKNKSITIKQADKGGSVVVLNTRDYITEAERQLGDTNTYQPQKNDLTEKFNQEVNKMLDKMVENQEITNKVAGILRVKKVRTPHFLPKIHKKQRPPPGRPIVSGNGCVTEKISAFIDIFLNPITTISKSFIKDTTDFVKRIENLEPLTPNTIIGTLDVTSLYTNIPNQEGIKAINDILNIERPNNANPKNETLVELLKMVLSKNNFQFNGNNYLQIGGTAMGTKVAPSYANLFMRQLEERLLESFLLKPKVWYRYIDDIFFIWEHGEDSFKNWLKHLNSSETPIQFTEEHSHTEIPFLDTKVKVDHNRRAYTDLYSKPTDSHSYLKYDSAHPPKCIQSLPYSQFLRIRRICTKRSDFDKHAKVMKNNFLMRGYPEKLLHTKMTEARKKQHNELLNKTTQKKNTNEDQNKIFMTAIFRPCKNSPTATVKQNWDLLSRSKTTKNIHRSKLTTSFKRPKNLKDILTRARTNCTDTVETSVTNTENKNICNTKKEVL